MQELDFYGLDTNYPKAEFNEDEDPRDFGGILEQAGLMSDSFYRFRGCRRGC